MSGDAFPHVFLVESLESLRVDQVVELHRFVGIAASLFGRLFFCLFCFFRCFLRHLFRRLELRLHVRSVRFEDKRKFVRNMG